MILELYHNSKHITLDCCVMIRYLIVAEIILKCHDVYNYTPGLCLCNWSTEHSKIVELVPAGCYISRSDSRPRNLVQIQITNKLPQAKYHHTWGVMQGKELQLELSMDLTVSSPLTHMSRFRTRNTQAATLQ